MDNELKQLGDFILKFTKFEFKEKNDDFTIWARFHYEGITSTVEGWSTDKNDEIYISIWRVILVMISEDTKKAHKIYLRNQKLENILNKS